MRHERILRDEIDHGDAVMRFRLFYEGPIYSGKVDVRNGEPDRRADHKHKLRRAFHDQLSELWRERKLLRENKTNGEILGLPAGDRRPLTEALMEISPIVKGYKFIPLVHERFGITCSLRILLQRRDRPGRIFTSSRDIDNRLKIIFDALKIPDDAIALGQQEPLADGSDNPLYVLLQKDELITHVSVETDDLLAPPSGTEDDDAYARALIEVQIGIWDGTTWFNLGFAGD